MKKVSQHILDLGFDQKIFEQAEPGKLDLFELGRVIAVHKDSYTLDDGEHAIAAELIGKIMYSAVSPLDYPAVGDWVLASFYDEKTLAVIHEILPRKSLLKRKTPGKKIDFQLIAANIDTAFIVQSLDHNFNLRRLERYLVMANQSNITPVVLLSKCDLIRPEEIEEKKEAVQAIMTDLQVLAFSNTSEIGLEFLKQILQPRMTYCLLGSSGVGKTTLLNNLIGKAVFKTKTTREKDSKGRHATTNRQLIKLDGGAMIVDTPGMRELGNFSVETGLHETFAEISALAVHCQFNDCTHENEKGCAVLVAVSEGKISESRYGNFIKMNKESRYHEMSYLEKRKRDKQFGKMVKSVMKLKKNKR